MENFDLKDFIQGIGALCETAGLLRTGFIKNGFTREEAVKMSSDFIIAMTGFGSARKEDEDG